MQRPTVEVTGHKAHGPVPQPGSVVIARVCFMPYLNQSLMHVWINYLTKCNVYTMCKFI